MNIKPIRNDEDLREAFGRLEFVYQEIGRAHV